MKKVISFILVFAMAISMTSMVFAADDPTVTMTADKDSVSAGETVTITLSIDQTITDLKAFQYNIEFDSTLFEKTSHTVGAAFAATVVGDAGTPVEGKAQVPVSGLKTDSTLFVLEAGVIATVTFTAKTDVVATTASFSLIDKGTTKDGYVSVAVNMPAEVKVQVVPGASSADGYTASIAGDSTNGTVRVGNTLKVNIGSNLDFAAAEMTITYDSSLVSFDRDNSILGTATVNTETSGTLKLADYGANKTAASNNYVLVFTANAAGDAVFKITDAGFGTGTTAETANLTAATVSTDGITIAIRPAQVQVSFADNNFYSYVEMVEVGGTFTFYPKQTLYSYELPTASVNGAPVTVTATSDGGWKIENVSGAVTINAAVLTPKSFGDVTYNGTGAGDITERTEAATYLASIYFTIPADKDPTTENGYRYDVTATIAGVSYTLADPSVDDAGNRTYTIPGADVKGAVIISVAKITLDADKVTVSIGGNASADGKYDGAEQAGSAIQIEDNGSATLTVNTQEGLNKGYNYEVKNGDETLTLDENGRVTIENISENTTITINKTVNVEGVKNTVQIENAEGEIENKNYVTLNGTNMWLIQLPNHVQNTETAVYRYNGQDMHWSEDHGTYVTVVISEDAPEIDADKFSLDTVTETPTIAAEEWDVNKSGNVDANDAQLIWNMYSNVYQNFTENVTAEKFLLADANHDGVLDLNDAVVIIDQIMGE